LIIPERCGAPDERRIDLARRLLGVDMDQFQPLDLSPMEEYGLVEAVVSIVEEMWTPGPAVLVIEDLHWADPSTLRCVRRLAKMVTQQAALMLLTARPDGVDVSGLIDPSGGMTEVRLEPLEPADVSDTTATTLTLTVPAAGTSGDPSRARVTLWIYQAADTALAHHHHRQRRRHRTARQLRHRRLRPHQQPLAPSRHPDQPTHHHTQLHHRHPQAITAPTATRR
jgi:hypothetical protein